MANGDDKTKDPYAQYEVKEGADPYSQYAADEGDVSDPTKGYTPPSTASGIAREGALGLFKGLGIPETQTPITDLAKGLIPTEQDVMQFPFAPAKALYGLGKGLYGAGKELLTSNEPEVAAHGLGTLAGQGLQMGGLLEGGEAGAGAMESGAKARGKLGDFLHDPATGEPRNIPKAVNDLAVNTLAPESQETIARRNSEKLADDLMKRGNQQKTLDRQAAAEARAKARQPIPMSGTMTNDPNLGPLPQRLGTGLVPPTATTTTGGQFVGKITPPEPSKIVEPGSTPPPQKITGQSWSRDNLISAIKDPQTPYRTRVLMAKELLRNLGDKEFPANFRYLLEGNAPMQPWRNLKR